jgi:hypothetical protein
MQDLNDFILSLIRNPAFSEKVNDIALDLGHFIPPAIRIDEKDCQVHFPDAASETSQEFDQQMVKSAEDPLFAIPKTQAQAPKEVKALVQSCLDRKSRGKTPQ